MNKTTKNIIFDFDSTLVSIEGIDELGRLRGREKRIEELTNRAMAGESSMENIFVERLEIIRPTLSELVDLASIYETAVTLGAKEAINWLKKNDFNIFVVSGGYDEAIYPVTDKLGISRNNVFANRINFDDKGNYLNIDESIPLWKNYGKTLVVKQIVHHNPGYTVCVGDGMSDWEAAQAADCFICFAAHVYRESVALKADIVVTSSDMGQMISFLPN